MKTPNQEPQKAAVAFATALALTGAMTGCENDADPNKPVTEQGVSINMQRRGTDPVRLDGINIALDTKLRCARELFHAQGVNKGPYAWMEANCPTDQLQSDWVKENCSDQPQMEAQKEKGNPLGSTAMLRECILKTAGLEGTETWMQSGSSPDSTVMEIRTSQALAQNAKTTHLKNPRK